MTGLVTMEDIAIHLGVSKDTIKSWRKRFSDFPPPDLKGPTRVGTPFWEWATVELWLAKHRPELL